MQKKEKSMFEHPLSKYGPDQLSYWVEDIDAACEKFAKAFGAGPFIKMGPIKFQEATVHGKPADPELMIALGMWGPIQVEFVQKLNTEPHIFDDFGYGYNHINICVDDPDQVAKDMEAEGYPVGMWMTSSNEPIYYIDSMAKIGHCIEIHRPNATLDMCKAATAMWDGEKAVLTIQEFQAMMAAAKAAQQ